MGPPGERPRRVPPAPLDLVAPAAGRRPRPDAREPVVETLSAAGHQVDVVAVAPRSDRGRGAGRRPRRGDPEALAAAGVPALGYYSHVDVETGERRGRRGRHRGAALADGPRTAGAGRSAPRQLADAGDAVAAREPIKRGVDVERLFEQAVLEVPGRPCLISSRRKRRRTGRSAAAPAAGRPVRRGRARGRKRAGRRAPLPDGRRRIGSRAPSPARPSRPGPASFSSVSREIVRTSSG